jgi:hypothetical protein
MLRHSEIGDRTGKGLRFLEVAEVTAAFQYHEPGAGNDTV